MENIIDALNWRYATKSFDASKKISSEDIEKIKEVLRLTPSSFWLQPWKFLIIENQSVKESLVEHSWGQKQVSEASHVIIFCRKHDLSAALVEQYIDDVADTRSIDKTSLEGYKNMMLGFIQNTPDEVKKNWADKQIYIALWNAMTALAAMKIDSCPMEWFLAPKYDEVLGLDAKWLSSVVVLPIGYRNPADGYAQAKKVRYEKEEIIEMM